MNAADDPTGRAWLRPRLSTYQPVCKVCGAPRYAATGMPLCRWHNHEYERIRHAAWRQKRKGG